MIRSSNTFWLELIYADQNPELIPELYFDWQFALTRSDRLAVQRGAKHVLLYQRDKTAGYWLMDCSISSVWRLLSGEKRRKAALLLAAIRN